MAARPRDAAGRPQPLQFLQRALAARPARSLFGRGRTVARRAAPRAGRQHPLCLRFHRRSLPRCAGHAAAGNLYAVSGLRRMAAGAPYDAAGAGGARRACRCHLAGRRGVCVAGLHPDESGPAAAGSRRSGRGGRPAAGRPRQRQDDRTLDAAGLSRAVLQRPPGGNPHHDLYRRSHPRHAKPLLFPVR